MYLITNRHLCSEENYIKVIVDAAKSGVENIIIREKDLDDDCLGKVYLEVRKSIDLNNIKNINLIINTNINVFENFNCDGIHLPFNRFLELLKDGYSFNNKKIIGLSLHSLDEIVLLKKIIENKDIDIDYITLSHIYKTKCKENLKPRGITLLKEARKLTSLKVVALGGILPSNVDEVLKYCDDFAVMSTVMMSSNVGKTVGEYLKK